VAARSSALATKKIPSWKRMGQETLRGATLLYAELTMENPMISKTDY